MQPNTQAIAPAQQPVAPQSSMDADRIGRIVAVTGGHAVILLDSNEGVFADNNKGPEIGTLLKSDGPYAITLALVSALSAPMPSQSGQEKEMRIVEVEFMGELPKGKGGVARTFRRGVSNYPSLGDSVYRASRNELALAYACDTNTAVKVGHIQQLITVLAIANHWKTVAGVGPVIQKRKDAEPLRANERFRANNRHTKPFFASFQTFQFGLNLGLAVGPHPAHFIGFQQGMMVWNAINRRAGNHDKALHSGLLRGRQQNARAVHVRAVNVLRRIQRQGRRGMNHPAHALHAAGHELLIANIPVNNFHAVAFGI